MVTGGYMINNEDRIKKLKEEDYQKIFGIKKTKFYKMLAILEESYIKLHKYGGSKPKLTVLDKLVITLSYYMLIVSEKWCNL